jgi:hypothetical protein
VHSLLNLNNLNNLHDLNNLNHKQGALQVYSAFSRP